jgi:PST family polysaccharide transporter
VSIYFSDNKIEAGHGRRSLRGGAVVISSRFLSTLIQVIAILALARLLSPEDYGLVSMVTAITGFAPLLVSLGTLDAVVQRTCIEEKEISALFWISVALGSGCALLMMACSPLIARFYGDQRLTMISVVSALTFIATALSCQHFALLRRAMKFRELAVMEVGANLLSASAAIAMAFYGFGYWALVLRPVMMTSLLAAGVWLGCRWLPPKPVITPGVKAMLRIGLGIAGFAMTDSVGRASDKIAIGYRSGAIPLGYYQNAMLIYDNLLDFLATPIHGVAVASLSKALADLTELRRMWRKALVTLEFYVMPAFGILSVTSQDLVVLLLGAKWSNAGLLLSILALRGIPHTVERTIGWLHVTAGRTDRWMRWGMFAVCVQLLALFCGLPFGPIGVTIAYVTCMFILFIPAVAYAGSPLGIRATDVIAVIWRPLTGSLLAVAIGFTLRYTLLVDASGLVRTVALVLAYTAVYLVTVVGLLRVRMPIAVLLGLVRDFLPSRFARFVRTPSFFERPD